MSETSAAPRSLAETSLRGETTRTPEVSPDRKTTIQTYNTVFGSFQQENERLVARLKKGEQVSDDQKQQLVDFHIAKSGRARLAGTDHALDEIFTPSSYKNIFTSPQDGTEFTIEESPPVEGLIAHLDRKIQILNNSLDYLSAERQSGVQEELKILHEQRNILIGGSESFEAKHRTDENPNMYHAWKEQEAHLISNDTDLRDKIGLELRKTDSAEGDWYAGEEVGIRRRELKLTPVSRETVTDGFCKKVAKRLIPLITALGLLSGGLGQQDNQGLKEQPPIVRQLGGHPVEMDGLQLEQQKTLRTYRYNEIGHSLKGLYEVQLALAVNPELAQKAETEEISPDDDELVETVGEYKKEHPEEFEEGLREFKEEIIKENPDVVEPSDFDKDRLAVLEFKGPEVNQEFLAKVTQAVNSSTGQSAGA